MDSPIFRVHEEDFHWASNASLVTLESSNNLANAISMAMVIMVKIYLQDINGNVKLASMQQSTTTAIMTGSYTGPFDDYNNKNDHQIWSTDEGDPSDDSDKINEDQAILSNSNATFKMLEGTPQAAASSGSSWLSSTQQNQKQLFSFMNGANGTQDFTASLLGSSY